MAAARRRLKIAELGWKVEALKISGLNAGKRKETFPVKRRVAAGKRRRAIIFGDQKTVKLIESLPKREKGWAKRLSSNDWRARRGAIWGLYTCVSPNFLKSRPKLAPKAIALMEQMLKDDEAEVRLETVVRLGYLDAKQSAAKVKPLLKDADYFVRGNAEWALGMFARKKGENRVLTLDEIRKAKKP
ncbi:MAG: HEAT repeat domain-containing protein [Candidatus Diapherotrites archaeon]|nr:HEAT repeat domain-containing protein [Candidatus Diapherotrites archaeon]